MFFRYSNFTQNLNPSPQYPAMGRPLTPQAFATSWSEGPPRPTPPPPTVRKVSSQPAARVPGQYPIPNTSGYKKLMDLQTKFCAPDGRLVWQKLPRDTPLYYALVGMVTVGTLLTAFTLKKMATPPQN